MSSKQPRTSGPEADKRLLRDVLRGTGAEIARVDDALAFIQGISNESKSGVGFPVTVLLAGQVVDGVTVKNVEWLEETQRRLAKGTTYPEVAAALGTVFDGVIEVCRDPDSDAQTGFLHLRDARVVTAPRKPLRVGYLRVKLSDVVGWSLGKFED